MPTYSFPQSVRKYIRLQKADIRRQVLGAQEQERRISKLYEDMTQKYQAKVAQTQKQPNKQDNTISAAAEKMLPVQP